MNIRKKEIYEKENDGNRDSYRNRNWTYTYSVRREKMEIAVNIILGGILIGLFFIVCNKMVENDQL